MCRFCGSDNGDVPCDIFEAYAKKQTQVWVKQIHKGNGQLEREDYYESKRGSRKQSTIQKKR